MAKKAKSKKSKKAKELERLEQKYVRSQNEYEACKNIPKGKKYDSCLAEAKKFAKEYEKVNYPSTVKKKK